MSRTYSLPLAARSLTRRTAPSAGVIIPVIIALGHVFRGVPSPTINTRSFTAKLSWGANHLWRFRNRGKYSDCHLCQNLSAHNCVALHDERSPSDLQKTSGADAGSRQAESIISGVIADMSVGSELAWDNGRQLNTWSISLAKVTSCSSSKVHHKRSSIRPIVTFLTRRIIYSKTPPWWLAKGEKCFQTMLREANSPITPCWLSRCKPRCSSASAPKKLLALSLKITIVALPRTAKNRRNAEMNDPVVKS